MSALIIAYLSAALVLAGWIIVGIGFIRGRERPGVSMDTLAEMDARIERLDGAILLMRVGGLTCLTGTIVAFISLATS